MQNSVKQGVLLVNLGTPDAPTPLAVRKYLAEFLWDKRVVDAPRPLWWLILHGIILRTRPKRVAQAYQSIWQAEGSPLLSISKAQQAALQQELGLPVALAMTYGNQIWRKRWQSLKRSRSKKLCYCRFFRSTATAPRRRCGML